VKLLIALGTRPEAIKLAPVILAARARAGIEVAVCNTGQHADLAAAALALFDIAADFDLDIMTPRQSLTEISVAALRALEPLLAAERPDWLVVQGDTTTAFAAALAGFYARIAVAHVEAGLRTGDIDAPWPEEMNRRLITQIARRHFAPLAANAENLRREGVEAARIHVTGNTGIDAIKWVVGRIATDRAFADRAQAALDATGVAALGAAAAAPIVLVTAHRRESFGAGFRFICAAIGELARVFPDRHFVYPVHPNPAVRDSVRQALEAAPPNLHLIEPLDYLPFAALMARAELILTDSGGIQEEAPSIGKRVIVMRRVTERPEGLGTGLVRLAGTEAARIVGDARDALHGRWPAPARGSDVYGDGNAAQRIVAALAASRD
jgi:UDP-N-acetylglucosamine 2-epimerase (non-hydrolysing)